MSEDRARFESLTLEDCMSAIIDYRGKTPRKTAVGIPLITAKVVKGGRIKTPNEFIDPNEYDSWMRRGLPKVGDVLLTTEAPLGEVAQLTEDQIALAQRLILLRGKPELLDNTYLKFLLMSEPLQSELRGRASGTTVVGIKQSELRKVTLPLPSIDNQRAIAGVLGALDDKIEQNRRTAQVLEQLARAIFRAWFVNFEPVKAKAEGSTAFPSMPQPVFDALPTRFIDSDIGPVPEGWEVKVVSEVFDVNPTRSLRKGEPAAYLDMKSMPTRGHAPDSWTERPFGSGMRFMNGDTLVARITPCLENGKTAFVDFLDVGQIAWGSTEYIVLCPKPPLPQIFAYCLARTGEFRDFAVQNMTGTSGRQRVSPSAMEHFQLAVPSKEVAEGFGEVVNPMFECIRGGMGESRKLAAMRDYLLPNLLRGEVRVGDMRYEAEEAAQ